MNPPEADIQEQADNCLLISRGDQISPHWLVFETPRDFLSAPRTFAVCRIVSGYELDWEECREGDAVGIQRLADHEGVPQWQINLPRLAFRCWGELELVDTVYGSASADRALMQVMTRY